MKQIVDKLNDIAKAIDPNVTIPSTNLITDSLDAITKAYGGTPSDSDLIVDKLEDIAGVAHGGEGSAYIELVPKGTITAEYDSEVGFNIAILPIEIPTGMILKVTINDVEYIATYDEGYGAYYEEGSFDFSEYPFAIFGDTMVFENSGTYTVEILGAGGGGGGGFTPQGTINITKNGEFIVRDYEYAGVAVYPEFSKINITRLDNLTEVSVNFFGVQVSMLESSNNRVSIKEYRISAGSTVTCDYVPARSNGNWVMFAFMVSAGYEVDITPRTMSNDITPIDYCINGTMTYGVFVQEGNGDVTRNMAITLRATAS